MTSRGVNKVSCIDPKDEETTGTILDGFALPASMGDGIEDGGEGPSTKFD